MVFAVKFPIQTKVTAICVHPSVPKVPVPLKFANSFAVEGRRPQIGGPWVRKSGNLSLKRLKTAKDIVIPSAGKGRVTVVMDKTDY